MGVFCKAEGARCIESVQLKAEPVHRLARPIHGGYIISPYSTGFFVAGLLVIELTTSLLKSELTTPLVLQSAVND